MIFGSKIILSFCSIAALSFCAIFLQTSIRPSDLALYEKLARETASLRSSQSLERHPAFQTRENTQKDIWQVRGVQRIHFQMHADHSKLSLSQKKDKIEATEELEHMTCASQIGLLKATDGIYNYPDQDFTANHIECSHILGEIKAGHSLLKSMQSLFLSNGVCLTASKEDHPFSISAQSAVCEMEQKKSFALIEEQKIIFSNQVALQMRDNLKATGGFAIYSIGSLQLYPEVPKIYCSLQHSNFIIDAHEIKFNLAQETILCQKAKGKIPMENKNPIFFSSNTLLWQKQNETIQCEQNVQIEQAEKFSILADFAEITLKDKTPSLIEMKNNVRLFSPCIQNKNAFALADTIRLDPEQQILILTANHPKRVLFWQDGFSLSAPEILIQKNPISKEEFIQGKGDIHFTFNSEEQNIINQFISNYL